MNGKIVFINGGQYLVKIKGFSGHDGNGYEYVNEDGLKDKWWFLESELELLEKGETNMNEKMKRDLIKMLFEKEFSSYDLNDMYEYKGRIITGYLHRDAKLIDFIEKVENEYGINVYEASDVIIEEFDIEKYKEEKDE